MTVITTLKQYYDEIKDKGYTPFCVGITGSQCYNLADDKSDIDAVAFVMPSWDNICFGRSCISEQLDMSTGAHCTLIDIRKLSKLFFEEDFIHYIPLMEENYVPPEFVNDFQLLVTITDDLGDFNKSEIIRKAMGMCPSNLRKIERKTAETWCWDSSCGKYYIYIRWLHYFVKHLITKGWDSGAPYYKPCYKVSNNLHHEWMPFKRGEINLIPDSGANYCKVLTEELYKIYLNLVEVQKYEPNHEAMKPLYDWQENLIYNYYWGEERKCIIVLNGLTNLRMK